MKRLFLTALLLLAGPALGEQPKPVITVQDALAAAIALRNLDGRMVIVKKDGADNTVMVPWEFGSGALRMKIATNLTILARVEREAEEARQKLVAEGLKKLPEGSTSIPSTSPEFVEFSKQYAAMMALPATGVGELQRIKASELKLDKNEIAATVLQALAPILDPAN